MIELRPNNQRKQNGYTLIELLLVVTVLALIAALGVKIYRDKAESDRVNIAALNIQHVLESGMAYNVANTGLWPVSNWSAACVSSPTDDFVENYLPNGNNQSNFGVPLCWSGDDATLGDQKAKRFWVAMQVPGSDATTIANTAKRIASRLPNAIIITDPSQEPSGAAANTCNGSMTCYVKAVVAVPSATSNNQNKTYVAGTGNCDSNIDHTVVQPGAGVGVSCQRTMITDQFKDVEGLPANTDSLSEYAIKFQCKPGETPAITLIPNFIRMDRYSKHSDGSASSVEPMFQLSSAPEVVSGFPSPAYYKDYHDYCKADSSGNVTCTVEMVATYNAQAGSTLATVGCTQAYKDAKICDCQPYYSSSHLGGCLTPGVDKPGAIGASYVAVCGPASAGPAALTNNQTSKSYW